MQTMVVNWLCFLHLPTYLRGSMSSTSTRSWWLGAVSIPFPAAIDSCSHIAILTGPKWYHCRSQVIFSTTSTSVTCSERWWQLGRAFQAVQALGLIPAPPLVEAADAYYRRFVGTLLLIPSACRTTVTRVGNAVPVSCGHLGVPLGHRRPDCQQPPAVAGVRCGGI